MYSFETDKHIFKFLFTIGQLHISDFSIPEVMGRSLLATQIKRLQNNQQCVPPA